MHDRARLGIADDGAARDLDHQRLAVAPVAALALSGHTVGRHIFALIAEVHQRGHIVVYRKDDASAAAAVAAVGTARCHVLLAVESHGTVAAAAGADGDPRFINK